MDDNKTEGQDNNNPDDQGERRQDGYPSEQTTKRREIRKGPKGIIDEVKRAEEEHTGAGDLCCRLVAITSSLCCGLACCSIWIGVLFVIPVAMLAVGAIHLKDCPREKYVPIWLLVNGIFGVLKALSNIVLLCIKRRKKKSYDVEKTTEEDGAPKKPDRPNPCDGIVNLFLFCWFICGCVWVYRMHKDYQWVDPTLDDYCHHGTYLFAFWMLTLMFIAILFAMFFCCCLGCCTLCIFKKCASMIGGD